MRPRTFEARSDGTTSQTFARSEAPLRLFSVFRSCIAGLQRNRILWLWRQLQVLARQIVCAAFVRIEHAIDILFSDYKMGWQIDQEVARQEKEGKPAEVLRICIDSIWLSFCFARIFVSMRSTMTRRSRCRLHATSVGRTLSILL